MASDLYSRSSTLLLNQINHEMIRIAAQILSETNVDQIINMGGSYICDLLLGCTFISNKVVGNFIFNEHTHTLYFVKYHPGSKWQIDSYFTINAYDIRKKTLYESNTHFKMIYIKQILNENMMEIFLAFHDKNILKKENFDLTDLV